MGRIRLTEEDKQTLSGLMAGRSGVPPFLASCHTQHTAVVKNYLITDLGLTCYLS